MRYFKENLERVLCHLVRRRLFIAVLVLAMFFGQTEIMNVFAKNETGTAQAVEGTDASGETVSGNGIPVENAETDGDRETAGTQSQESVETESDESEEGEDAQSGRTQALEAPGTDAAESQEDAESEETKALENETAGPEKVHESQPDEGISAVQDLVDALPDPEEVKAMDTDGQRAAYEQVQAAYEAYLELTEGQQSQITGAEVFETLFAFFNGQIMMLAGFSGGDGLSGSPYQIKTAADLKELAEAVNNGNNYSGSYFKLMNDIDLNGSESNPWTPIGDDDNPFDGTFDGGGHTISGLYINNSNTNEQGLFGYVTGGGTIKDLGVSGKVSGKSYVGGVVGYSSGAIESCYHTGEVSGEDSVGGVVGENGNGTVEYCYNTGKVGGQGYVGGVVGYINGSATVSNCYNTGRVDGSGMVTQNVGGVVGYIYGSATVSNCYNIGEISGEGEFSVYDFGGVVGENDGGTVSNCYNIGEISGEGEFSVNGFGGVVGQNYEGTVSNCYNTGNVTGGDYAGGVVGENNRTVENCYNTGNVTGERWVGGVVGQNDGGTVSNCYNTGNVTGKYPIGGVAGVNRSGTVENCYNTGNVTGEDDKYNVGGVMGENSAGTVKACFYLEKTASGGINGADNADAKSLTTDEFKNEASFTGTGWDFTETWSIPASGTRPLLRSNSERIRFGGEVPENGTIVVETTYGQSATVDLDHYMKYEDSSDGTGKFSYTIARGNETLGASVAGSTLTIPGTAKAGEYTLTVTAHEKEPKYVALALNFGIEDVTLTVAVRIRQASGTEETPGNPESPSASQPGASGGTQNPGEANQDNQPANPGSTQEGSDNTQADSGSATPALTSTSPRPSDKTTNRSSKTDPAQDRDQEQETPEDSPEISDEATAEDGTEKPNVAEEQKDGKDENSDSDTSVTLTDGGKAEAGAEGTLTGAVTSSQKDGQSHGTLWIVLIGIAILLACGGAIILLRKKQK